MNFINFYGIKTIIYFKIILFIKEFQYSIIAPIISSFIFIIILGTISKYYKITADQNNFMQFIIPGILVMIIIQETYSNISETLIHMKQTGSFNDILIAPISRIEIAISFILATTIIGIFISIINYFIISLFIDLDFYNLWRFLYYIFITSLIFSSIGSIIGFVSYTWDTQQSFFNLLIYPISLLSGTFFSINTIDPEWKFILLFNPFYYLVRNFRESFVIDNQFYNFNIDILLIIFLFIIIYFSLFIFYKGYRVIK